MGDNILLVLPITCHVSSCQEICFCSGVKAQLRGSYISCEPCQLD